jgi:hypothetical protein
MAISTGECLSGRPCEIERFAPVERRLREEPRPAPTVAIAGVHQERMAKVDIACLASRERELAMVHVRQVPVHVRERHAGVSGMSQRSRDVQMRADADPRRSVVDVHVREEDSISSERPSDLTLTQ